MKLKYLLFLLLIHIIFLGCQVQGSSSGGSSGGSSGSDNISSLIPGTLDNTFKTGSGINGSVNVISEQADNKILIGGYFSSYNGITKNNLARINPDGAIDSSFNPGSSATETDGTVLAIALQSDGKILIGGKFNYYNAEYAPNFARINSNGTYDSSFNTINGPNYDLLSIAIQKDGKILIGGFFTSYNGIPINRIARINIDGTLDTSFNPGTDPDKPVESIVIQPDGRILIAGGFKTYNNVSQNYIARLNNDGSLDTNFTTIPGADDMINIVALQPDDKILVGGWFTSYDIVSRNCIARVLKTGSFDPLFSPGTGISGTGITYVSEIALQTNGKILLVGDFISYNGVIKNNIVRLNSDGSIDDSFDSGTGTNSYIDAISIQPDGKILIGGSFTSYNNISISCIIRIIGD